MKLFLILLAISLQVSAAGYSQEITLSLHKASLKEVMQSIRKQTGYSFVTESVNLKTANPVTITLHTAKIEEALLKIFETQPFSYLIENKSIIIKKKDPAPPTPTDQANTDPIIIKGKVTDRNNKPLPGVNIRVKGRDIGTVTDVNGNYILKTDSPGVLLFSYIGFRTYEKKISTKAEVNISLEDISAELDQVQIIAYGSTTKRLTTSNINTIKGEEISQQPVSNILLAMQGKVPGIFLSQSSGIPGSDVKVRVQGENSIQNGNEAFYVVDGIPMTPQNLYSGISVGAMPGTGSTLSFINQADIESIEVLKDADATAIYGSRAANGAILITTKKGKDGKTRIDLNMQSGWGKISTRAKLLNTEEYIAIRNEALKNNNESPGPSDYDINGIWDKNRYTDWQKKLIGGTSNYTNLQSSISGGNSTTQFVAGGGYMKETTVYPSNFSDTKSNISLSLNHISLSKIFEFSIRSHYLQDVNKLPTTDLTINAVLLPPNAPEMYKQDGTINWETLQSNPLSATFTNNPATALLRKYRGKTSNLLESGIVGVKILPGLKIKTSFGFNRLQTDELAIVPQTVAYPAITRNVRSAVYGDKSITSWILEPQMTYTKEISNGKLDVLLGTSFQSTSNSVVAFKGTNYGNDAQLENSLAAGTITPDINTMKSEYRYNALFGRANYQFNNRYIVNATARRDGSSRFGSENKFNNYYSIGVAWVFGDEEWFQNLIKQITFGKLRVTYGTTGNDQIQDYQYLSLYNNYTTNVVYPYQQIIGLLPIGHSNPYLQWEETRKLNIGIDLGLWENRILINANYYKNRSSNQLLSYPLPYMTGFQTVQRNLPALIQNSGFELLVDANAIRSTGLNWQISLNITIPKNKLLKYPGIEEGSYSDIYMIGKPISIQKVYDFAGVNEETGSYQFKAFDGKTTSTPDYSTDKTKIIDLSQKLYGGITNNLTFKHFSLSILFQFVKQMAANNRFGVPFPGLMGNQPANILDHWKQNGDIKNIQKVTTSYEYFDPYGYATQSDAAYSDASFVRLKNLSISYAIPERILKKVQISVARIYVQGQNLFTFSKFKDADPETRTPTILPPLRVLSTGIQLSF